MRVRHSFWIVAAVRVASRLLCGAHCVTNEAGRGLRTAVEKPDFAGIQFVIRRDHLNAVPLGRFL